MTLAERRTLDVPAVRAPVEPTPPAPGSTQAAWAVDWRFLLPDPGLGAVAVLGRVPAAVLEGLTEVASSVSHDPPDVDGAGRFDTIVLGGPRPRSMVPDAARLGTDTSSVWVPWVARRSRRGLANSLRRAGFGDVTLQWHRPSLSRPTLLVSLADRPTAGALVHRLRSGPKSRLEALAARSGAAARLGSAVAMVATRGAETRRTAAAAPGAGRAVDGLITPRFSTSRAVVGVTLTKRLGLDRVAKVPRSLDGEAQLVHEAAALAAFGESGARATIPIHYLARRADRLVLIETAASGKPLDPELVRADRRAALKAAMAWLNAVPVAASSIPSTDGRHRALIEGAAEVLRGSAGGGTLRARAVEHTLELLEPLWSCPVPMVFEHGDLSHPNLFLRDGGELEVIDWERAVVRGFPLHDAYFFCGYLAVALERPRSDSELVAAYLRTAGTHGWARSALELHAEHLGVDPKHLGLLELAAWFRATASVVRAGAGRDGSGAQRAETIWMARLLDLSGSHR